MSVAAPLVTWGQVASEAAHRLRESGVADAQSQARRLVEQASGYEGGEYYVGLTKAATQRQLAYLDDMLARRPDRVIRLAVRGMLPKNALGRRALKRLRVYDGPEHPHEAQRPQTLEVGV